MPIDVARLRELRRLVEERVSSFVDDLKPFLRRDYTCCRLPSKKDEADVSVTTACTCLMAAVITRQLERLYRSPDMDDPKKAAKEAARTAFENIMQSSWVTAGLPENNNFTRMLVLRVAGVFKNSEIVTDEDLQELKHQDKTIREFAGEMLAAGSQSFNVGEFGPKPAIAYWFLDALDNLGITPSPEQLSALTTWAVDEFRREFSYVVANYDAMLDPVAMVMAACVVQRLHRWRALGRLPKEAYGLLPPIAELRHAVVQLFAFQGKSGIWPKYFPLFNYPADGTLNYCFTFEFLEAIATEFSDPNTKLFDSDAVLKGIELAIRWCNENRLQFYSSGSAFYGWNSGTQIKLLREGIPESWATAAIHMFLARVQESLSAAIDAAVIVAWIKPHEPEDWDRLIDAPLTIRDQPTSLKKELDKQILQHIQPHPKRLRTSYRTNPISGRRSAVLFGPPGTSKTTIVRALADKVNWPYVEITPSDFVGRGMEQIHARTTEIFRDLSDLAGAVVLFDEMDALAAKRDVGHEQQEQLDVVRQLLTTGMLPKLADLFRRKQIVYFMNTNHRRDIDSAIMRAGRFDILLHVAPPTWDDKLNGLRRLYRAEEAELATIKAKLQEFTRGELQKTAVLDRFTFSEMSSFLEHIAMLPQLNGAVLSEKLTNWNKDGFLRVVDEWGEKFIVLKDGSKALDEFNEDRQASALQ
jgi:hypothetical protein